MLNSAEFVLLITFKLLQIAKSSLHKIAEHEDFSANKYENANYCWHFFYLLAEKLSCSAELGVKKVLQPRGLFLCLLFSINIFQSVYHISSWQTEIQITKYY